MTPQRHERALVRPHVVTGGRAHPTRNTVELVTLVTAAHGDVAGLSPEKRRVVQLCQGGSLSVAEVAAHLSLPISVIRVLISDLVDSGHIVVQTPATRSELPRMDILQEVLDGLRARL
jgi:hypothetical protein